MTGADLLLVAGVFVGGAAPWLEAVVVVPAGIAAGLHPVTALLAGCAGNLLTVAVAAWCGERLRRWWARRRRARRSSGQQVTADAPATAADASVAPGERAAGATPSRARRRVERLVRRWGMPALAVLGPVGWGTQLSAFVAVSLGVSARVSFVWIAGGTVVWSIVAAVATVTGLSVAGVGA